MNASSPSGPAADPNGAAPERVPRPKLAKFLFDRDIDPSRVAPVFGVQPETVRRWCLPFGHRDRRRPKDDKLELIIAYTQGEVTAADFYPPHLNGGAPDAADPAEVTR